MQKLVPLLILNIILALYIPFASATVHFDIGSNGPTGNRWQLGTGWGTGSGQLDAVFKVDANLPSESFNLNPGGTHKLNFGSVQLVESSIDTTETDNLDVTGYIYFDAPAIGDVGNPANVVAFTGNVSDWNTDLKITFAPVYVNFGSGGKIRVDFSDLVFKGCETLCVSACVTLVCDQTPCPEPGAIAIWSLFGGLGLVFAWRKRRTA